MKNYRDFEDYLQEKHAEQYDGLDDEMPDNYEEWLADLDVNDLIKYGNQYAKQKENKCQHDGPYPFCCHYHERIVKNCPSAEKR